MAVYIFIFAFNFCWVIREETHLTEKAEKWGITEARVEIRQQARHWQRVSQSPTWAWSETIKKKNPHLTGPLWSNSHWSSWKGRLAFNLSTLSALCPVSFLFPHEYKHMPGRGAEVSDLCTQTWRSSWALTGKGVFRKCPTDLAVFVLGKVKVPIVSMKRKKTGNTYTEMSTSRLTCGTRGNLVSGALLFALKFPLRMLCISVIVKEKQF